MTKLVVPRTELIWPGKYDETGARREVPVISVPFQVIETANESRATREAKKIPRNLSLFDVYDGKEGQTFEDGWRNKLIWGDNLLVLGSLLGKFAHEVDLIYIDPPFATGIDFSVKAEIGDGTMEVTKEPSIIEEKAYRDTWSRYGPGRELDSYLEMIAPRLSLMRDLLSDQGSLFVHVDYRAAAALRFVLDDVFGPKCFRNEIVWHYKRWPTPAREYQKMHDNILWYTRTPGGHIWHPQFGERAESTKKRWGTRSIVASHDDDGVRQPSGSGTGESPGAQLDDTWDISIIAPKSHERVGYATQKPKALLRRIIAGCSNEGSLVADFFCGSGTTLAVAEELGRRWIGCDLGRFAIHTGRKRLLEIEDCKPFEVLNLGKYERQYWQGITFGDKDKSLTEQALYEYLAFILKLYGAEPITGLTNLHGKKGKAMVHIGAVEAPVTIDEINASIAECVRLRQGELHVLGWDWEMGLYDLMVAEAKKQGIKLTLLHIPREVMEAQAVEGGDIQFFELAFLEVEVVTPKKLSVQVALKNFVISNTDLIPEEVRSKVTKWSDYIDYWAVDWSFQNDTFMHGWVTYRTRQNRALPLKSDLHVYTEPGNYVVLVKVVDIFGNDTSKTINIVVK
jgi:adenine-specific DNA-methyltransferase